MSDLVPSGSFSVASVRVEGASAEVCSVLLSDATFLTEVIPGVAPELILDVFDTRKPHEERVPNSLTVIRAIAQNLRVGRWLPIHTLTPGLEYASKYYPGYRDHTIHSLNVFLLGWYLFRQCSKIRTALTSYLRTRYKGSGSLSDFDLFREWWGTTALWHDLGYPFEATAFIEDPIFRDQCLANLSAEIGRDPFKAALEQAAGRSLPQNELRVIYQAGGYYPWRLERVDALFENSFTKDLLNRFWRVDLGADDAEPLRALLSLTLESPRGRPPYYDHGLLGALLLGVWWSEVVRFTVALCDNKTRSNVESLIPLVRREELALELMELEGPLVAAVESIAFHNFAWSEWRSTDLQPIWSDPSRRIRPSLQNLPHLFFLSLVDTLQDWDRHHFQPLEPSLYRPATPAGAMLIQAKEDCIAISLKGKEVRKVHDLFRDWLDADSVSSLICGGAIYSLPNVVTKPVSEVTIQQASLSEETLKRLESLVRESVPKARTALIQDPESAVLRASAVLEDVVGEVQRLGERLLPRERDAFSSSHAWHELSTLQAITVSMLRVGMRVGPRRNHPEDRRRWLRYGICGSAGNRVKSSRV